MREIEFKKIEKGAFSFTVDGEELGDVYEEISPFGLKCWMAVDNFDGLSVDGPTKKEAVQNLLAQRLTD